MCLGSGVYIYARLHLCVCVCVGHQNELRLRSDAEGVRRAESLFWTCLRLKMSTWFSSAVLVSQALTQTAGLTTGVFMYVCVCVCVCCGRRQRAQQQGYLLDLPMPADLSRI